MFYSQFILAKKGPLGTIWIAAHLERKLRKNQVADTDIGVSVDSIICPEVPIALRLSSHLMLGVVRIYSRKVNYLFHDCSEALLKVKQAFRSTAVDLPPEESTAPYHSITLPETFDLDDFELPDNAIFDGNYVDHHVSTREQITLQDTMHGAVFSTTQFGLDERFGDGDASQIGLDLDEEMFLGKSTSLQNSYVAPEENNQYRIDVEQETPLTNMDVDDRQDGLGRHNHGIAGTPKDMSNAYGYNIRTPDLNEMFSPAERTGSISLPSNYTDPSCLVNNSTLGNHSDHAQAPPTPGLLEEVVPVHSHEIPDMSQLDKPSPTNCMEEVAPEAAEVECQHKNANIIDGPSSLPECSVDIMGGTTESIPVDHDKKLGSFQNEVIHSDRVGIKQYSATISRQGSLMNDQAYVGTTVTPTMKTPVYELLGEGDNSSLTANKPVHVGPSEMENTVLSHSEKPETLSHTSLEPAVHANSSVTFVSQAPDFNLQSRPCFPENATHALSFGGPNLSDKTEAHPRSFQAPSLHANSSVTVDSQPPIFNVQSRPENVMHALSFGGPSLRDKPETHPRSFQEPAVHANSSVTSGSPAPIFSFQSKPHFAENAVHALSFGGPSLSDKPETHTRCSQEPAVHANSSVTSDSQAPIVNFQSKPHFSENVTHTLSFGGPSLSDKPEMNTRSSLDPAVRASSSLTSDSQTPIVNFQSKPRFSENVTHALSFGGPSLSDKPETHTRSSLEPAVRANSSVTSDPQAPIVNFQSTPRFSGNVAHAMSFGGPSLSDKPETHNRSSLEPAVRANSSVTSDLHPPVVNFLSKSPHTLSFGGPSLSDKPEMHNRSSREPAVHANSSVTSDLHPPIVNFQSKPHFSENATHAMSFGGPSLSDKPETHARNSQEPTVHTNSSLSSDSQAPLVNFQSKSRFSENATHASSFGPSLSDRPETHPRSFQEPAVHVNSSVTSDSQAPIFNFQLRPCFSENVTHASSFGGPSLSDKPGTHPHGFQEPAVHANSLVTSDSQAPSFNFKSRPFFSENTTHALSFGGPSFGDNSLQLRGPVPRESAPNACGLLVQEQGGGFYPTSLLHSDMQMHKNLATSSLENSTLNKEYDLPATSACIQIDNPNCSASSEYPEPERMLRAPASGHGLQRNVEESTLEKRVTEYDGSVDRLLTLSGKKRRLTESTPTLLNESPMNLPGAPRLKKNISSVPDDNDLLGSILVGRTTPSLKVKPTPNLPMIPSSKRARLNQKIGTPKRKVLLDDTMVLHADAIRQQLMNTEDIRRVRKKAPCTRSDVWRIQKCLLEEELFGESTLTGISDNLTLLHYRVYNLNETFRSGGGAYPSPTQVLQEQTQPPADAGIERTDILVTGADKFSSRFAANSTPAQILQEQIQTKVPPADAYLGRTDILVTGADMFRSVVAANSSPAQILQVPPADLVTGADTFRSGVAANLSPAQILQRQTQINVPPADANPRRTDILVTGADMFRSGVAANSSPAQIFQRQTQINVPPADANPGRTDILVTGADTFRSGVAANSSPAQILQEQTQTEVPPAYMVTRADTFRSGVAANSSPAQMLQRQSQINVPPADANPGRTDILVTGVDMFRSGVAANSSPAQILQRQTQTNVPLADAYPERTDILVTGADAFRSGVAANSSPAQILQRQTQTNLPLADAYPERTDILVTGADTFRSGVAANSSPAEIQQRQTQTNLPPADVYLERTDLLVMNNTTNNNVNPGPDVSNLVQNNRDLVEVSLANDLRQVGNENVEVSPHRSDTISSSVAFDLHDENTRYNTFFNKGVVAGSDQCTENVSVLTGKNNVKESSVAVTDGAPHQTNGLSCSVASELHDGDMRYNMLLNKGVVAGSDQCTEIASLLTDKNNVEEPSVKMTDGTPHRSDGPGCTIASDLHDGDVRDNMLLNKSVVAGSDQCMNSDSLLTDKNNVEESSVKMTDGAPHWSNDLSCSVASDLHDGYMRYHMLSNKGAVASSDQCTDSASLLTNKNNIRDASVTMTDRLSLPPEQNPSLSSDFTVQKAVNLYNAGNLHSTENIDTVAESGNDVLKVPSHTFDADKRDVNAKGLETGKGDLADNQNLSLCQLPPETAASDQCIKVGFEVSRNGQLELSCPIGDNQHISLCQLERETITENAVSTAGEASTVQEEDITIPTLLESHNAEATGDPCDEDGAVDGDDKEILNVGDEVDLDDDNIYDTANPEESQSQDNSGWSARTRGVARYLKLLFNEDSGHTRHVVALDRLLSGKTRKEASRMFFETLVLKTKDYIHVEQENSFANIDIKPRSKLLKLDF